jgi:endonuclease YncB( thermonuclease family)
MALVSFLCLAAVPVDGDTLRCSNIRDAGGRVRLARIDAPERGAPGAAQATAALRRMIAGQKVHCRAIDADPRIKGHQPRDRFGRIVARCRVGEADLSEALLAGGFAVVWPRRR